MQQLIDPFHQLDVQGKLLYQAHAAQERDRDLTDHYSIAIFL